MNSLNVRQLDGGNIIKQADSGSLFKFELLDENYKKFETSLLGETATVILKQGPVAFFKKVVPLSDSSVSFNLDKILAVGDYVLEIIVGNYVFPSSNRVIITVEQTYGDFQPEYLVKVSYEELKADVDEWKAKVKQLENTVDQNGNNFNQELIAIGQNSAEMIKRIESLENREDKDTIYDDTELRNRVAILESKEDLNVIYDDTEIKNRLTILESRPSSSYDDTEIKNMINQLESDISTHTSYNDTELRERITTLENRNIDIQPYDDSEVKERLTNLEIKSGAEGNTEGNASYQSFMENLSQLKYAAYGFVSSDVYGVEVDMVNKTVTRISGSIGKSGGKDFDNIRAYQRRRCNLTDDGKVLAYFGDYGYVENGFTDKEIIKDGITYPAGTRVQVMVEQPKFFYRVIPLVLEPIPNSIGFHMRKGRYYICDTKKEGFKVHPAFEKDGVEKDLIYLSAYEVCIFDESIGIYKNFTNVSDIDFANDKLSSISGVLPQVLLWKNEWLNLSKSYGDRFNLYNLRVWSLTQLLFLIEYGTFNVQSVFDVRNVSDSNMLPTGNTSYLGNVSGVSNDAKNLAYRGEENLCANSWINLFDINVYIDGAGVSKPYVCTDYNYKINTLADNYESYMTFPKTTWGYISSFGYSDNYDWAFLASECKGDSAIPVGDFGAINTFNFKSVWGRPLVGGRNGLDYRTGLFAFAADGIDDNSRPSMNTTRFYYI